MAMTDPVAAAVERLSASPLFVYPSMSESEMASVMNPLLRSRSD